MDETDLFNLPSMFKIISTIMPPPISTPAIVFSDYFGWVRKETSQETDRKDTNAKSLSQIIEQKNTALQQQIQSIKRANENTLIDKVKLSKTKSKDGKTRIVFNDPLGKKLYETNPQFRAKIDSIAKTLKGETLYVNVKEYENKDLMKNKDNTTKPPKPPKTDWLAILGGIAVIVVIIYVLIKK